MTINLNQYPYYDDYDKNKDFHQVMFKPGIPVQARELTQIQSILQNQISSFGDHIFNNGSRVNGAKLSYNQGVYSLSVTTNNLSGLSVGNYIKGLNSGMVGEVIDLIENKNNKSYIIYVPRGTGSNKQKFTSSETIIGFLDGTLTSQLNVSFTTEAETTFEIVATGSKNTNSFLVAAISNITVGSYIETIDSYVTKIDGIKITINQVLENDLTTSVLSVTNTCTCPTTLIGVSDGVFYTNGRFARVGKQQIVPDVKNRWITTTIGLITNENFVSSDEDQTLLDPAQGSYNYMAPGADRLKISLDLVAYADGETKDTSFIELFRFEDGVVIRQNESSSYSTIMKTLAERTYDESGNYVVSPFLIRLLDLGDENTITASISPGKAYVGGYEFETISTTKLQLDRARDTEKASSFGVTTYVGNHLEISGISGAIPASGSTVTFKNQNGSTAGTAIFLNLAPQSNGKTRMYVTNINGTIASATTVSVGSMTANIFSQVADVQNNNLVFPAPQTFVKSVENINYTTPRMYRHVPFTNGVATLTALNTNERFSGGTGILNSSVANEFYQVFNASGLTMTQVDVKPYIPGTTAQVEVSVNSSTFNGYGDIIVMVEVNDDNGRVKAINQSGILLNSLSTTFQSLKKADFHQLQYVSLLNDDDVYSGKWDGISYPVKSVVYHNGLIYRALATNTTTNTPSETNTDWELVSDISDYVTIDTGQRDTYYDHAYVRFTTESAITSTNNRVVVVFDYFKHSGMGALTVNSYPLEYSKIPSFTGSNGIDYELRNCFDYRPRRADDSTTLAFDSIQFSDDAGTEADITYYLARIDKIVITNDQQFKVLKGVSSYYAPRPPMDQSNAMTIAMIIFPPYTDDVSKIALKIINNRRYTMRDIGLLDTRITNVEKYTNLNTLENKVLNKNYYGPTGIELFKSGFLTDGFESYLNGNTSSPEYRCSLDTKKGYCRPLFTMDAVELVMDTNLSTSQKTTTLVTAPYTEKVSISNPVATGIINVNPFNVIAAIGNLSISPSSDYWFDTKSLPVLNVTNTDALAFDKAASAAAAFNASNQWSAWTETWTGSHSYVSYAFGSAAVVHDADLKRTRQQAEVTEKSTVVSDNTVVVSKETQPYCRQKNINFEIHGMMPNTRLYGWIDDVSIDQYVTPKNVIFGSVVAINVTNGGTGYSIDSTTVTISGGDSNATAVVDSIVNGVIKSIRITNIGSGYTAGAPTVTIHGNGSGAVAVASISTPNMGTPIVTDTSGYASGVLSFPNDDKVKFVSGKHRIMFGDSSTLVTTSQFGDATYTSEGYIQTTQRTIQTTKSPVIITNTISETKKGQKVFERWYDPVAQSFLIDGEINPHGIFTTGFNFYFSSKDPIVPITLELRPTVNGYPSSYEIIPASTVVMTPDKINVSTDASVPTRFKFTDPIYLTPGEYVLVLKSGSNRYNVFISEMNKTEIGTDSVVSKQPYLGSLFESQNASTWTAEQLKDLKFDMFQCEFSIGTTQLVLKTEARTEDVMVDLFNLMAQNIQPELTKITAHAQLLSAYSQNVLIGTDNELDSLLKIKALGDGLVNITMTTGNKDVSPVVDLERTALICIHNLINDKSDSLIPETDKREGDAISKYVLKTVTLNEGFSASSLCVQLSVNRPAGSSIQVFARFKNDYDIIPLAQKNWILLTQEVNGGTTSTADDFVEDMWSIYDHSYDGFVDYNQFEVKVVFWSPSSANVPTLDDIRAVALA